MNALSLESTILALLLGVAVAFVHMMFQLGVSVLTLLSGHSLGAKKAHIRLLHLNISYIFGAYVAIVLILLGLLSLLGALNFSRIELWIVTAIVTFFIGCAVSLVYYRRGKGTLLWVPRTLAEYLSARAKKTKYGFEAGMLGAATIVAELPFAIAPLLVVCAILHQATADVQLLWILIYALLVVMPLLVIAGLVSSGHKISTIQRWREENKSFLQYSGGVGLIIVALYLIVFHIMGVPA